MKTTTILKRLGVWLLPFLLPVAATAAHNYVNLGLPSGTLWADCNVGASAPEGYGNYYAWGETATKTSYSWSNYKYCSGSQSTTQDIGTHIAGTSYDAATKNWGSDWVMPTLDQANELLSKCTVSLATVNNVKGLRFKGPNGNTIFFPMAGYKYDSKYSAEGTQCYIWTDTKDIVTKYAYKSMALYLERSSTSAKANTAAAPRRSGVIVRAVKKAGGTTPSDPDEPVASAPEMVDLGLSVKWCSQNLGADYAQDYGDYYAWGETSPKSTYTWANYKHASGSSSTVKNIGSNIQFTQYDAAWENGTSEVYDPDTDDFINACLPTKAEWEELRTKCTWKEATEYGVKGYRVTGSTGNSIFLPFTGSNYDGSIHNAGTYAYYWTSEIYTSNTYAYAFYIKTATAPKMSYAQRRTGLPIRAVGHEQGGGGVSDDPQYQEQDVLVDLGLSVRWCSMNIGASEAADYGSYYSWGETDTKSTYTWANYKHASGSSSTVKNIGSNIQATQYDVAYEEYESYDPDIDDYVETCLPTKAQWEELRTKCTWKEATEYGIKGYRVTGTTGESIFLPFSGSSYDGGLHNVGTYAYYWTSEIYSSNTGANATAFYIKTGTAPKSSYAQKRTGLNIRAVEYKTSTPTPPPSGDHNYVDLGLPSGTLWADCNVGASKQEGYGDFYAWGETATKSSYTWSNYKYCSGSSSTAQNLGTHIAGTSYDAAKKAWGDDWVMPTLDQANELLSKCTVSLATVNNVKGIRFKGPNGNTIFFPMTGYKYDSKYSAEGTQCYIWTDTKDIVSNVAYKSMALYLERSSSSAKANTTAAPRRSGVIVRAVKGGIIEGPVGPPAKTPELVDLGLSVKWCDQNMGSSYHSEYGKYYAWGETSPKSTYTWANYQHASGSSSTVKNIGSNIQATQYDAAFMGDKVYAPDDDAEVDVCIPTKAQWEELRTKCTWTETTEYDHKGYRVKGPSGKSIFLPLSGSSYDGSLHNVNTYAYYWTSEIYSSNTGANATAFYIKTGTAPKSSYAQKRTGLNIRAVERKGSTPPTPPPSGDHDYVNLGLPSGTLWATCNVGASAPEGYGNYYAWGETSTKSSYSWSNYLYCSGSQSSCQDLGTHIAGTSYDAAKKNWGSGWVMPTLDQANELLSKCTVSLATVNGVAGLRFKGPNGNTIFFPMAGYKYDSNYSAKGTQCYIWTDTKDIVTKYAYKSMALYLERSSSSAKANTTAAPRRSGVIVRAVRAGSNSANSYDFDTDGVHGVNIAPPSDGSTYTIQGVKVEGELKPGIYIRNGKKFVVK